MKYLLTFLVIIASILLVMILSFFSIFGIQYLEYKNHVSTNGFIYALYEHPSSFQEHPFLIVIRIEQDIYSKDIKYKAHAKDNEWKKYELFSLYGGKGFKFDQAQITIVESPMQDSYLLLKNKDLLLSAYNIDDENLEIHFNYPYGEWKKSVNFMDNNEEKFREWLDLNINNSIELLFREKE